jgi:hypothetical protein
VTVVDSDDEASVETVRKVKSRASYKRRKENGGYDGDSDDMEYLSSNTNDINVGSFTLLSHNNSKTKVSRPSLKIRQKTFASAVRTVLACIPPRKLV